MKNLGVFELKHVPMDKRRRNIVKNRWVFKKNFNSNGKVTEWKARLVAKGFSQKWGVDFAETFAPVAKLKSIRAITTVCSSLGLKMLQDDVPSAFLRADFKTGTEDNEGWTEQPNGFNDGSCRVRK